MPHCESWRMVWQMQVETCHALWSRLVLYWPGQRARREALIVANRDRMLQAIYEAEVALDNLDNDA